ncbi:MAG: HU family DNA-binding protein [Deltaproteobacteria bacterium]|jgi:nucleoid DNA-binding protein|nr:HU family DNA-binding protein [Deltaproteobacteria bacterium]
MTKAELVAKIATENNLSQAQAAKTINCLIEVLSQEIAENGSQTLYGLGTFSKVTRAARSGVNPRTKEIINIPATNTVKFKCAPCLKKRLNDK